MSNKALGNSFEEWLPVLNYEGVYSISNLGRVMSHHWGKQRVLRQRINKRGYVHVNLSKDGKIKTFRVHSLVAKHFVPNPRELTEINHKDEDKLNNRADNLEWCTRSYNVNYGKRTDKHRASIIKNVVQYDKNGEFITTYDSLTQASQAVGATVSNIAACCKGKRHCARGYIWKYVKEDGFVK